MGAVLGSFCVPDVERMTVPLRTNRCWAGIAWFVLAICIAWPQYAWPAEGERGVFTDPEDGKLDASEWLIDKKGFLPVPIIITEPAVGYGGGVGLMFFRNSIREVSEEAKKSGHITPPDIFGVAMMATENGTKVGAVGGMFSFADDRWRYRGGLGAVNVNLDFYGAGGTTGTAANSIGYNLQGWMSSQQVLRRLGQSNNFIAAKWIYLDLDNSFDAAAAQPPLSSGARSMRSSGLGLAFEHDSRDNIFTPSRGWTGAVDAMFYSPEIGSDNEYQAYRAHVFAYQPVGKTVVVGGRLDGRTARGDVPFYQLPFIDMRGIPAGRYQDKDVALAETEVRWNLTPRWALIGFVGAGRAWGTRDSFSEAGSAVAKGGGVRYLVARRLGLFVGVDVAWGPEDRAFYLQVGNAWR